MPARTLEPRGPQDFSLGGYTVAALLGAHVDGEHYRALITGEIAGPPPPEYPNLAAELRERLTERDVPTRVAEAQADYSDKRIRARFLICPAMGDMLDSRSLAAISWPVAVLWTGADEIAPAAEREPYLTIPRVNGQCVAEAVGHYAFLADNRDRDHSDIPAAVATDACKFFETHLRHHSDWPRDSLFARPEAPRHRQ